MFWKKIQRKKNKLNFEPCCLGKYPENKFDDRIGKRLPWKK